MRIPIIAGNWKMYKTIQEAIEFVNSVKEQVQETDVEVVICSPYTALADLSRAMKGSKLKLAAQNMHWEEQGAFTGEISGDFLVELGVEYVILGHSERRQYFNETDEMVNRKVLKALEKGLKPIICVGETLEEREDNETMEIVKHQVRAALEGVTPMQMPRVVIAYEPIWAIGTGRTASPEDANEVIAFIREVIKEKFDDTISEAVRIQYGGSVKPANATEIMQQEDIDGALVGGASLVAADFLEIVNF